MAVKITADGIKYTSTGTPAAVTGAGNIESFSKVYNAVWNDYVDAIPVDNDVEIVPGYCYSFDGKEYHKSDNYMDRGFIGIESDTYGQLIGYRDQKQLHIPVAGFVLAYVDKEYPVGTALTCTEDGILTKIEDADKRDNPEMVLATYWKKEEKTEIGDGTKFVQVNGRTWVKVK